MPDGDRPRRGPSGDGSGTCGGNPVVEICDGVDNNCDGATDEGCCGADCLGETGRLTPAGRGVRFSCRAGDAGPDGCDECMGWQEITCDQWLNQGYCSNLIQSYRDHDGTLTRCGPVPSCCASPSDCFGGDNARHFHDGVNNSGYTRISAWERR